MAKSEGIVVAIFVAMEAGAPMEQVESVGAYAGEGLAGDRYSIGQGSFNKGKPGKRQVTLIEDRFLAESGFAYSECRRNIVVRDVELMQLIGQRFSVGSAVFLGVKYCAPCNRPSKLAGKEQSFREQFEDRGGIIAEVCQSGVVSVGSVVAFPSLVTKRHGVISIG